LPPPALLASVSAQAQVAPLNFDQAAYITCREAHAMQVEPRRMLALYLADHAARHRGVAIPDGEQGPSSPCWSGAAARWRPTPTCSR
jgi:hypothetical protein